MSHVFISYVSEDAKIAQKLTKDLQRHGVTVWLDKTHIPPGVNFSKSIRSAISSGDFFLACFSENYWNRCRNYMNEELSIALDELRLRPDTNWFIPVLLSACKVPDFDVRPRETLRSYQWVPLHEDWEEGLLRIVNAVNPLPSEVRSLLEAAREGTATVKSVAIAELAKYQDQRVVDRLAEMLHNVGVREDAAKALAIMETGSAVERLVAAFVSDCLDESAYRDELLRALMLNGPIAVPLLAEALGYSEPAKQLPIYDLLRSIGLPSSVVGRYVHLDEHLERRDAKLAIDRQLAEANRLHDLWKEADCSPDDLDDPDFYVGESEEADYREAVTIYEGLVTDYQTRYGESYRPRIPTD